MPISFPVARGTIVLCDYNSGFREPEMVKRRPAVVISHRLPHRDGLCSVVPLSTTPPPKSDLSYVCTLTLSPALPTPFDAVQMWVKADMLATVALSRLDLFRTGRDTSGRRKYIQPRVSAEDMERIERCICCALGMAHRLSSV